MQIYFLLNKRLPSGQVNSKARISFLSGLQSFMKFRKKLSLIAAMLFVAILPLQAQTLPEDTSLVAVIDGNPVTTREFMLFANKERSEVIRFFRTNYGCEYDNTFWTKSLDGKSPTELLKERTLDTLIKIKVQQACAKDFGLVSDISYSGFLLALKNENLRRLQAKNSNKVIYGPVQYSEEVYFNYTFTNMVEKLKAVLAEKVFAITKDTLLQIYETEKDRMFGKGYCTKIRSVGIKYKTGSDGSEEHKISYLDLITINESIKSNKSYIATAKEVYKYNPYFSLEIEDIVFNDTISNSGEDNNFLERVKEMTSKLSEGESSPVLESPRSAYIFTIINKQSLGYRSFDNCKRAIREKTTDQLYSNYINKLSKTAMVHINKDVYNLISF
jgi:hypothetical protein